MLPLDVAGALYVLTKEGETSVKSLPRPPPPALRARAHLGWRDSNLTTTCAMVDDADNDVPAFEKPDRELVYRNYLEACRRLGIKPTPQGRAEALIKEWAKALAAAAPPTTH